MGLVVRPWTRSSRDLDVEVGGVGEWEVQKCYKGLNQPLGIFQVYLTITPCDAREWEHVLC